jgi:heat shock protein HtpX
VAERALNLLEQQAANRRATGALVLAFVLFFAWLGFGGDAVLYFSSVDELGQAHYRVPIIGIAATTIAAITALVTWRTGPRQVLWASGARPLETAGSLEERQLLNVVEEMAIAAGLPRPRVYLIDDADPNAFATGHDPSTACIAVTTGMLTALNREELQAVVGHEMAHVRNLDVRLMTVMAALVGVIVLMSDGLGRALRGGARGGGLRLGGRGGRKGGAAGLALVILVLWLISLLLAPLISRLMAMAIARKREYLADATSAELTRNPAALASALEKLEGAAAPTATIKRGTAHLCIVDPLGRRANQKDGRVADLMGTHPPIAMRISRLRGMAYQQAKREGSQVTA